METLYYTEYYLVDAIRLADHFAESGGRISEGIGDSSLFPKPPKTGEFPAGEVRFVRVEVGDRTYAVAFITNNDPPAGEWKYRNKSLYRVLMGEQIKRCRERRGLSIEEVASISGFRPHSLVRIEEGRWDIDIAQLGVILDALAAQVRII